jgi:hypothetical protein
MSCIVLTCKLSHCGHAINHLELNCKSPTNDMFINVYDTSICKLDVKLHMGESCTIVNASAMYLLSVRILLFVLRLVKYCRNMLSVICGYIYKVYTMHKN